MKSSESKSIQKDKNKECVLVKKSTIEYKKELKLLQIELSKLQKYVKKEGIKVLIIFEGRDAAGKGGTIQRVTQYLNPRGARIVALSKPSDIEKTEWYFQRYIKHLPFGGEMVFFDRSWYNRAMVEPVMGFCTPEQSSRFLREVPVLEILLTRADIKIIKFYFSVSKDVQKKRFEDRKKDPRKYYKLSPVDEKAQDLWDEYTVAEHSMLLASHTKEAPWCIVNSDNKKKARLNAIKYILSQFEYDEKTDDKKLLEVDPKILKTEKDLVVSLSQLIRQDLK